MSTQVPRHPVLLLADHEAPNRRTRVNSEINDMALNFFRNFDSFLFTDRLFFAIMSGCEEHAQWVKIRAELSETNERHHA